MRTEPVGTEIGCSSCGKRFEKELKHSRQCKKCRYAKRNENLRKTNFEACKRYEKTKKGFLMRAYRNMKSRVEGIQWKKAHLYEGMELLPKEEFYEWSLSNPDFHELFETWEKSGYNRKLTPSIDRINSQFGYFKLNMQWITHSENSRRGSISQWYGRLI